jgi:hypothetical protein
MPVENSAGEANTLKDALQHVKTAHKNGSFAGNKKAVIVINGTITAAGEGALSHNSLASITGAGYPPVVLRGGDSGGVLDGEGQARVLYVTGQNTVTIADGLTLTRGNTTAHNEVYGGGVYLEGSTLTMSGGTISDCTADYGSGVHVCAYNKVEPNIPGSFAMTGGTITGGSGSGVFVDHYSSFTLSGSSLIEKNGLDGSIDTGGGVMINGHGTCTMSGGTIRGNKATLSGGGVNVTAFATFTLSDGTITENTAPDGGGSGVFVSTYGAVFTNNGGDISGNHGNPDIVQCNRLTGPPPCSNRYQVCSVCLISSLIVSTVFISSFSIIWSIIVKKLSSDDFSSVV